MPSLRARAIRTGDKEFTHEGGADSFAENGNGRNRGDIHGFRCLAIALAEAFNTLVAEEVSLNATTAKAVEIKANRRWHETGSTSCC
jgi:hypothetical protein